MSIYLDMYIMYKYIVQYMCKNYAVRLSVLYVSGLHVYLVVPRDKTSAPQVCETCFCENVVQDVSVIRNVQYGRAYSEKHGRDEDLMLDVYKPDGAKSDSKAPAVLLIHGGNFIGSSRHSDIMVSEAFHFAKAGFVVFNIDYRLDGSTYLVEVAAVRDAVHDAKAAVRFIVDHAESYGVDSTRIAAWGESAGGITAISMNSLSSEGFSGSAGLPSNISAAVSISGTIWPFLVAAPTNDVQRVTPWFNLHSTGDATVFPFLAVPCQADKGVLGVLQKGKIDRSLRSIIR